jgi:TRAP-type C4-dicarboxylate transport system substrate-binding protein
MPRKFFIMTLFVFTGALCFCFAIDSAVARPKKIRIKIATLAPEGTPWMKAMRGITKYVEDNSNGKVKFNYYTGGVMGDEPDIVRKMKLGVIGGTGVSLAGVCLTVPEFQVMEMPFLFQDRNFKETDFVYEKTLKYFSDAAWKNGYKLIAISEAGFAHFWTKGEVTSIIKEFPRQRVWQWEGEPVMAEISRSLNVPTVSLPLPETLTALQTGMINAFYGTPMHVLSFQWNKFVDTVYLPSIFYTPSFFILTQKAWGSLPEESRKLFFDENAKKITVSALEAIHRADDEALKALVDSGVKVVHIPPDELEEIKKMTKQVWTKLAGSVFSKEIIRDTSQYLEEYRNRKK